MNWRMLFMGRCTTCRKRPRWGAAGFYKQCRQCFRPYASYTRPGGWSVNIAYRDATPEQRRRIIHGACESGGNPDSNTPGGEPAAGVSLYWRDGNQYHNLRDYPYPPPPLESPEREAEKAAERKRLFDEWMTRGPRNGEALSSYMIRHGL